MQFNFKAEEREEVRLDSLSAGDFFEISQIIYMLCNKNNIDFPQNASQLFAINLLNKHVEIFEAYDAVIPIKQLNKLELSY